ncbi:hypothetical protein QJ054_34080 [Streptomyces sp. AN-3]|uniref:hypothetical protein n=1 Tax=Streptomyces sp. AN-3 TaxID=3044177 RepID=UPI00249B0E7E|nr:hypothetical protein [Streptomyces sp. AN-3]MDI3102067.1 hypothetical protein [Streptomyces sp. AN-3]
MPMSNHCKQAAAETAHASRLAFAVSAEDLQTLDRITGQARAQLARLVGEKDLGLIDRASGTLLMLVLSERAGAARVLGHSGIPMLVDEVTIVQGVVLNLETYGGETTALVEGYNLLNRITLLAQLPRTAEEIKGVLILRDETPEAGEPSAN